MAQCAISIMDLLRLAAIQHITRSINVTKVPSKIYLNERFNPQRKNCSAMTLRTSGKVIGITRNPKNDKHCVDYRMFVRLW